MFVSGGGVNGEEQALDGTWRRLTVTGTPGANTVAWLVVETTSAQIATIEASAWQFEQSAHATAYLDGSMGPGFGWIGAPDGSASTRAAGRLSLPARAFSAVSGGVAFWWRPDHGASFTRDRVLFRLPAGSGGIEVRHVVSTNRFRLTSPAGDAVEVDAPAFAGGDDLLVSAGWTARTLMVGCGEAVARGMRTPGPWLAAGRADLASGGQADPAVGLHADGAFGPMWWFDRPPVEALPILSRAALLV
jgi:hypothetical protein